jgi:acetyl esterase/lipase
MAPRRGVPFHAMTFVRLAVVALVLTTAGCTHAKQSASEAAAASATAGAATSAGNPEEPSTLLEARKGFVTKLRHDAQREGPPPAPPSALFSLVRYPAAVGPLAAYVSPRPADARKRPAIVWIVGGFSNSIDDFAWAPADADDDQSARAFREAGIVLMLPSLRGGNDNPGERESFYGEVDDVIAAGEYVRQLDYVDSARVYLGGHSTGGTLALLAAESSSRFRTVFSFGPTGNVSAYGDKVAFDTRDEQEVRLRSPMYFTSGIRTPTWILEGENQPSNVGALPWLLKGAGAAPVRALKVPGVSHFSVLAPATALIARKILADIGPTPSIVLTEEELASAVGGRP